MLTVKPESLDNLVDGRDEHLSHGDKAPCIQIRRLVSGFDPRLRKSRWIVIVDAEIFQAVLDESGYGGGAENFRYPDDVFIFAGYIGKVADWETFTHAWDGILTTYPELKDVDFVKGLVRFQGRFSDPRAVELMKAVTDIPGLGSVRWRLPYSAYRSVVLTQLLGGNEAMYFFAWFGVLSQLLATISMIPNAKLDLFYDENLYEEQGVQLGYERFRDSVAKAKHDWLRMLPLRPVPMNDKDFWPVRAADALAWNTHRHFIRAQKGKQFSNPLWRILDSGPNAIDDTWDAEAVRDVLIPGRDMLRRWFKERS
jgi:hypothetical protein